MESLNEINHNLWAIINIIISDVQISLIQSSWRIIASLEFQLKLKIVSASNNYVK